MSTSLSDKLTILLVIRDRNDFTFRWLKYAYEFACQFHIYIADGGSNTNVEKYIFENKYNEILNITYVKTEYDGSEEIYYSKVSNALSSIKTKYIIFADDDDFYSFNALERCIAVLEKDNSIISCGGKIVHFKLEGDIHYGVFSKIDTAKKRPYSDPSPINRMVEFFHNNSGIYYNVNSTNIIKDAWLQIVKDNYKNIRFPELLTELYVLSIGKIHYIEDTYYFRQGGPSIGNSSNLTHNLFDEITHHAWSSELHKVLDASLHYGKIYNSKHKNTLLECYKKSIISPCINGMEMSSNIKKLMLRRVIKNTYFFQKYMSFKYLIKQKLHGELTTATSNKNINKEQLFKEISNIMN